MRKRQGNIGKQETYLNHTERNKKHTEIIMTARKRRNMPEAYAGTGSIPAAY